MIAMEKNELYHHSVKGQKWGVRRYQNYDGTLTSLGVHRARAIKTAKTKKYTDYIYNSLSDHDKYLLGDNEARKEWLNIEEGEYVVKRFIQKDGDIPVALLDIFKTTSPDTLTVAIATNPKYRGLGYGSKLTEKGKKWFDENADKLNIKYLE